MKKIAATIDDALYQELKGHIEANGQTIAGLIRKAIRSELKGEVTPTTFSTPAPKPTPVSHPSNVLDLSSKVTYKDNAPVEGMMDRVARLKAIRARMG